MAIISSEHVNHEITIRLKQLTTEQLELINECQSIQNQSFTEAVDFFNTNHRKLKELINFGILFTDFKDGLMVYKLTEIGQKIINADGSIN